jgi:hypothetical protein
MAKFIPLTKKDVEIEIFVEVDHCPIRGNASASGNDEYDKKVEDEIIARLNDGDVWAWASVEVCVYYDEISRSDYLGCCTYKNEKDFIENSGYYDDMVESALEELNDLLQDIISDRTK